MGSDVTQQSNPLQYIIEILVLVFQQMEFVQLSWRWLSSSMMVFYVSCECLP